MFIQSRQWNENIHWLVSVNRENLKICIEKFPHTGKMYKNRVEMYPRTDKCKKNTQDIKMSLSSHGVKGNISTLNLLILPILFNYFDWMNVRVFKLDLFSNVPIEKTQYVSNLMCLESLMDSVNALIWSLFRG